MNNKDRKDKGLPYIADRQVCEPQKNARILTQQLNTMDRSDFERIRKVLKKLFGKCENLLINPPFYCDYGFNIEIGNGFFANYNCSILDSAKVIIGENVLLGPNVSISTSGHPIHSFARQNACVCAYAIGVTIGNNCWIGSNSVICPGVHIGNNVVIGAGSVVTKDIPDWSLAAGNPCKVVRKITDEDCKYYFKDKPFDEEMLEYIAEKQNAVKGRDF